MITLTGKKVAEGIAVGRLTFYKRGKKEIRRIYVEDAKKEVLRFKKACEKADVTPLVLPIRGGTDGCQLSFKGLPCPNLGTGGHAYHGPYEHITVEGMDKSVDVVTELVKLYAM